MDIYEFHEHYRISLKKSRLMLRDGRLKLEEEKTPKYWRRVIDDIKKGKLSARSIALAYRFPGKLEKITKLTLRDRRVIASQFEAVEFPPEDIDINMRFAAPIGAIEKHPMLMREFINAIQDIIPDHDVSYYCSVAANVVFV